MLPRSPASFHHLPCETLTLALLLVFLKPLLVQGSAGFQCSAGLSKSVCLPDDYSKFDLPHKDQPNKIQVEILLDDILEISDLAQTVTFSTFLNLEWQDPRLTLLPDLPEDLTTYVPVELELVEELWLPNVFIYNMKSFDRLALLRETAGLWVSGNKTLLYSLAARVSFLCFMRFGSFPFDTQVCEFRLGSYSYDKTRMTFTTKKADLTWKFDPNGISLDYDIELLPLAPEEQELTFGPLGDFSVAGLHLVLRRHWLYYLVSYFLPSGLCVALSWVTFLLPPSSTPRPLLLAAALLLLAPLSCSSCSLTPRSQGLTLLQIWLLACSLFIWGAAAVYAVLLVQVKVRGGEEQEGADHQRTDSLCLRVFPALFTALTGVYWLAVCLL